ncbi:MAG: ABC transporter permease subunit, partial [Bdellovibrionota bacterium]
MAFDSYFFETLFRTLALGTVVATLATFSGVFAAWTVERSDLPARATWARLLALPYSIPGYLIGMAAIAAANQIGARVYGFWGMALVESAVAFAFPFLEVRATLVRMDPAVEEAARMSGASPARVFAKITVPLALPAVGNGWILAFLYAVSSFGVPALIGLPDRKPVLTTWIYSSLRMGGEQGLREAAVVALLLLALCGSLLFAAHRIRASAKWVSGGLRANRPTVTRLSPFAKTFAFSSVALFFVITSLAPWLVLLFSGLAPIAGSFAPSTWTFRNFEYVIFGLPDFKDGLLHSTGLALLATFLIVA